MLEPHWSYIQAAPAGFGGDNSATLVLALVFVTVFAVVTLCILAFAAPTTSKQTKATLAAAIRPLTGFTGEEEVDVRKNIRFSSIPWLHHILSRFNVSVELRRLLTQADLSWTPGRLILTTCGVWIIATYALNYRFREPKLAIPLGMVLSIAPFVYVMYKRNARLNSIQEKLPEALDLMVSALRAGHSMGGALGAAAREAPEPLGREFRLCFEEQNFGIDLRTATDNLIERVPLADLRIVTTAMLIHKESGGNLAEVLDKTGLVIRDRFRLQQQIRVHTAQGKLTGLVLMLLPLILAAVLSSSNPAYMSLLYTRPLGHQMLAGAVVMNVIGLIVIRRIINIRI